MIKKKYKHIALGLGVLIIVSAWFLFANRNYCFSVPITFGRYDFPFIDVEIENQVYSLQVDIGARFPMFLNKEILDVTGKDDQGVSECKDIKGNRYEIPTYLIPKIKVGDMVLSDIEVRQSRHNADLEMGKIGKFLGTEVNLLLDFPHSRIIACDSFSKLKKKKLAYDNWIKIPFEMSRVGVILKVNTDIGITRLSLNTSATTTGVRPSFIKGRELWEIDSEFVFHSHIFTIGEKEFNGVNLHLFDITSELNEIDGSIGMDFLKKHALYIDYRNKFVYIEPPKDYFDCLSITFGPGKIPYTNAEIEGESYLLEFDLGSGSSFSINQQILNKINKSYYGTCHWTDFKGNKYESPAYAIPEIKIGNLIFDNVIARQDRQDFHESATLEGEVYEQAGVIGRPFLEKCNLFLDFRNAVMYACNSFSKLRENGLISEKVIKVPFIQNDGGILLDIDTDIGLKRFSLDTGATSTVLRATLINTEQIVREERFDFFITSKLKIGENDFGETKILLLELHQSYEFDGSLGMDFLKKHPIYIDYFNRLVYIDISNLD